jgi:hypothetical protein
MRYGVHKTSPRFFLPLILVSLALYLTSGCGSGGGSAGGNNNAGGGGGGGGNTVILRGVVRNFAGDPIQNALIEVVGTTLNAVTDNTGVFTINNLPQTVSRIRVTRPIGSGYYNVAQFGGQTFDLINCTLPLPGLILGTNNINEVTMYGALDPNAAPPPPPPIAGCP